MAIMNMAVHDAMKGWVTARRCTGRYSNASDYVRDLIRRDQDGARALAELQQAITEGIESGIDPRSFGEILAGIRASYQARTA